MLQLQTMLLSPSWVISKPNSVIATLVPDHQSKRFKIEIKTGATAAEMKSADSGTVQDGRMVYSLDGKTYSTTIKTLRGDFRTPSGENSNQLRRWEKSDFKPRPDDIFQERLYAVQWVKKITLGKPRQETFFAAVKGCSSLPCIV